MSHHKLPISGHAQRGFTLVEVLVSIVVVAFGLLGVAGLLVKSASLGVSAHNRTLATQKVYEMVDRMRLNSAGVRDGNYDSLSGAATSIDCSTPGVCSAANVATYDYYQWTQGLATALSASATGTVQANGSGLFTITVIWPEKDFGLANFQNQTYTLSVRP